MKTIRTSGTEPTTSYVDSKRHYAILDGLRGVAAIVVVIFHLFEAQGPSRYDQIINHGYLAVDFFFLLSGFVIGYAYDDRWGSMSLKEFFKRRLIRLHPMIVLTMILGAMVFYFQGGTTFSMINEIPVWQMLLILLIGMTLIPILPSMDIRGWSEMHPLNGPAWTLFFEYVGNILYALFVRKFSNTALAILVFIVGCLTVHYAVTNPRGDFVGGWSLHLDQLYIGFIRLLFPFFAGLLLSRIIKVGHIKHAFLLCSVLLITALSIPRIGDESLDWLNGLYEAVVIILIFPLIVFIGASGEIKSVFGKKICSFLGDISYPIYIIHGPFLYIYIAWIHDNKITPSEALPVGIAAGIGFVVLAYLSLKWYDIPVRKWLTQRYMKSNKA